MPADFPETDATGLTWAPATRASRYPHRRSAAVPDVPDGHVVRALIVSSDDQARRLAYSVVEGSRPALGHHHASLEVRDEGKQARLIWISDNLPDASASEIRIRIELGIAEMKRAIEATVTHGC
jgi:hypothetical protein